MNNVLNRASFGSRIGRLNYIWLSGSGGTLIVFLSNSIKSFEDYLQILIRKYPGISFVDKRSGEIEKIIRAYLSGKIKNLDIKPQFYTGTAFEREIWKATLKIPYGSVSSYREVAESSGHPGAWRAAGTALNHNPVMLVVPCHRVIKSSGKIGFFGGGEEAKKYLLDMEQP